MQNWSELIDLLARAQAALEDTGDLTDKDRHFLVEDLEISRLDLKVERDRSNWETDEIQFPRLIAELEEVGAFRPNVCADLCKSMDLKRGELDELVERAQRVWDSIKART